MNSKTVVYIIKRVLLALVTLFLVITVTFLAINLVPGGPFTSEKSVPPETLEALKAKYGLDKPPLTQYFTYLGNVIKLDFGPSMKLKGRQVSDIISYGFKTSAKIGGIAALFAIVLGLFFGTVAAINRNKWPDKLIMVVTTAAVAMPSFVIGTFLLLIFCVKLNWFPADGGKPNGLILPIIALALYPMSYITRLTRSSMLDVLGQDFIRTARAKGVSYPSIIYKHSLKNALIPVITYVGPMLAYILTGSMVVEKIFHVAGLGSDFVSSISNRDYSLILGTTIFLATLIISLTLISDILYKVVDPRIELN